MDFYEKILSELKTRYAKLGLGNNLLGSVAKSLAGRVTEEAQIETAIGGVEPVLQLFQSELDKIRNEKTGLQKQVEQLTKAEEAKAEKEKEGETSEEQKKETVVTETPEQIFERLFQSKLENLVKTSNENAAKQAEQIQALSLRLNQQDEARAEAEKLAAYKAMASRLGIAEAYDSVVLSFAATAKDAQDFESMIKGFQQSLIDDGSKSATPPETPLQKEEKEGEAIAHLINEGTKQIVEQQNKKD